MNERPMSVRDRRRDASGVALEQDYKSAAVTILRSVGKLRARQPQKGPIFKWFHEVGETLPRGAVTDNAAVDEIYAAAVDLWADAVAKQITFEQWYEMVHAADDVARDEGLPVDGVRFFENAFEGLTLACGARIWG